MAVIKIHTVLNVEKIYCTVTCPECGKSVHMKMRGPDTRKTCPGCNHITYMFTIVPLRGYIQINVLTIGRNETPTEYELDTSDVEVIEDEENEEE